MLYLKTNVGMLIGSAYWMCLLDMVNTMRSEYQIKGSDSVMTAHK